MPKSLKLPFKKIVITTTSTEKETLAGLQAKIDEQQAIADAILIQKDTFPKDHVLVKLETKGNLTFYVAGVIPCAYIIYGVLTNNNTKESLGTIRFFTYSLFDVELRDLLFFVAFCSFWIGLIAWVCFNMLYISNRFTKQIEINRGKLRILNHDISYLKNTLEENKKNILISHIVRKELEITLSTFGYGYLDLSAYFSSLSLSDLPFILDSDTSTEESTNNN